MTSISSMETITPDNRRSTVSSPSDDEDLGARRIWEDGDELHSVGTSSSKSKGKGKRGSSEQENGYPLDQNAELLDEADESEVPDSSVYPPTTDQDAETRRVEENLRRWQVNEMQKRKAARDSVKPSQSDPGWSLLWQNSSSQRQRSLGKHAALGSEDSIEQMPLDNLVTTPGPSPPHSPLSSSLPPNADNEENPFANPVSPFEDSQQVTAVMSPSDSLPNETDRSVVVPTPERPILLAKSASFSRHPPPKPLNLPPPKTPPPVDLPPHAVPPLSIHGASQQHEVPERETRWWHEWLCGCGEDREADNQGGRTNPFE